MSAHTHGPEGCCDNLCVEEYDDALKRHQERCGTEFCVLHQAAPDLLAALEELVTFIETWPSLHEGGDYLHGGALLQARAAIAKAREVKP